MLRVTICAVGRLKPGPERDLFEDYAARFDKQGRKVSLGPVHLREVEARRGAGPAAEAPLLKAAVPEGSFALSLDERGRAHTSPEFARLLAARRDEGVRDLAILIGGADGLDRDLRAGADLVVSLGPMVWPHMLVRVMLAEQLYRAASILSGTPYHRE